MDHPGTVYWITGLSGAGKSTIGRRWTEVLRRQGRCVIYLDGDEMREVFGQDAGFSADDRKKNAMRYSRLCKMLSDQGVDVVCATISMFKACRSWNRANISRYKEIYLKVPIEVLIQRDQKQLYSRALNGEMANVMGIDMAFEEPENPDLTVVNDGTRSVEQIIGQMTQFFLKEKLDETR